MSGPEYSVKCPCCSARATAQMRPDGCQGTYRQPAVAWKPARITCAACGYSREISGAEPAPYELWYATAFKNHRLWAHNPAHLDFLIAWLAGPRIKTDLNLSDCALVESLSRWMILAKNREAILHCLQQMRQRDDHLT